jgi:hypothetical protein
MERNYGHAAWWCAFMCYRSKLCNDKLQLFALKSDPWRHDRARIVS